MRKFGKFIPVLAVVGCAANAHALCGSADCDMTAKLVSVEPPSACVGVRAYADDCDCALVIEITNNCDNTVDTSDFEFEKC